MSESARARLMSADTIAAGGPAAKSLLHWPERGSVFAERQMRLRQLAPGHAMADFLRFMAELARAQHKALQQSPDVPLPDRPALERADRAGLPVIPAADWPRDAAWREALRAIAKDLRGADIPEGVRAALDALDRMNDDALERQADCLLTGVMHGLDLAAAPLVAAALQVYWTRLALGVQALVEADAGAAAQTDGLGRLSVRIHDPGACPCCGSRPTASLTRSTGAASGQRFLHCSLCSVQWPLPRIQCAYCMASERIFYQSLDAIDASAEESSARAAQAAVQAECCEDCGHYLKIMHRDRDGFVEPVADDLATITLDLLVSEAGLQRHGVNLMLLFGDSEAVPGTVPSGGS